MRLIDADALENAIDKERQFLIKWQGLGAEHVIVHHAWRLVEDAPTIPAIPVSWMQEKIDGYAAKLRSTELAALVTVMQMWEQEGR